MMDSRVLKRSSGLRRLPKLGVKETWVQIPPGVILLSPRSPNRSIAPRQNLTVLDLGSGLGLGLGLTFVSSTRKVYGYQKLNAPFLTLKNLSTIFNHSKSFQSSYFIGFSLNYSILSAEIRGSSPFKIKCKLNCQMLIVNKY